MLADRENALFAWLTLPRQDLATWYREVERSGEVRSMHFEHPTK